MAAARNILRHREILAVAIPRALCAPKAHATCVDRALRIQGWDALMEASFSSIALPKYP